MFRPKTSPLTRDDLLEADADWTIGNADAQAIHGSSLRLIPTEDRVTPLDLGWPSITWGQEEWLYSYPGDIAGRWSSSFNNQVSHSPQIFAFDTDSGFLDITTEPGEYQYHTQLAGGPVGKTYWADNVDNSTGWTVQLRIQVLSDATGGDPTENHFLVVDDGTRRERLFFASDGIHFETATGLSLDADMTRPREIRLGALEDDIYLLLDDGRGIAGINQFTGSSSSAELGFGRDSGVGQSVNSQWDYVNQFHGGLWGDTRPDIVRVYATTPQVAYSPSCAPDRSVHTWVAAYVNTTGTLANGTTGVTAQYRSSTTSNTWQDFTTTTVDVIGQFYVDLDLIPTAGDNTDELRFKISQYSATGEAEAPRVESISLLVSFDPKGLVLRPYWGHRDGDNTVIFELDPTAVEFGRKALDQQSTTADDTTPAKRDLYVSGDGEIYDAVQDYTGVGSGILYRDGLYGQAGYSSTLQEWPSAWDDNFTTETGSLYGEHWVDTTPVGNVTLSRDSMYNVGDQTLRAEAHEAGAGFSCLGIWDTSNPPSAGPADTDLVAGFALQIDQGSVKFTHGTEIHTFHKHDYLNPLWINLRPDAGNAAVTSFTSDESGSAWRVGSPRTYRLDRGTGTIQVLHTVEDGFGAEGYFTAYELGEDLPFMSTRTSNSGWEVGVTNGGIPYVEIGDGSGTDRVDGNWPIRVGERKHVALNYRPYADHNRLQVLVDGEICGEKITTLSTVAAGTSDLTFATIAMQFEEIATQRVHYDAADLSIRRGFSAPIMDVETDVPQDDINRLVLRFERTRGAIVDDSGRANHAYSPLDGRTGFTRDTAWHESRRAGSFWHTGEIKVLHTSDFLQSLPQSLYVEGFFRQYDTTQTLYSKYNAAGTLGWKVEILSTAMVKVTVEDGVTTHTLTSTNPIATNEWKLLCVNLATTGITIQVGEDTESYSGTIASLVTATEDAEIGTGCMAWIDTLVLRAAALSSATALSWFDRVTKTRTITDKVYVDNVEVPSAQIRHVGMYRKYVVMPSHVPGEVPVHVVIESRSPGIPIVAARPYKYTYGYKRVITGVEGSVFSTKSPFRITARVPDDGVGVSFFQGPDLDVYRNVALTDLSYKSAENLSTYFGGEFNTHTPIETGSYVTYASQLDTADLRISNKTVMRRGTAEPYPLYYKYLVGRRRFYVYNPNAVTTADVEIIRSDIKLVSDKGTAPAIDDFPWDIEISKSDAEGQELPTNVFSVVVLTRQPMLRGVTLWVQYDAMDRLNGWRRVNSMQEVLNPVPLFESSTGTLNRGQYSMTLEDDGTYSMELWNE